MGIDETSGQFIGMHKSQPLRFGLALQGGGAHGAFTAGALEALMDSDLVRDGSIKIEAISGTSAGAMNGAIVASALNNERHDFNRRCDKAIQGLNGYWGDVADGHRIITSMHQFNAHALSLATGAYFFPRSARGGEDTPVWPNLSQGDIGRLNSSASGAALSGMAMMLRRQIGNMTDLAHGDTALYVNAVRKIDPDGAFSRSNLAHEVFSGDTLSIDSIVASGALKILGPKKIGGVGYYDGAYLKNPAFDVFDHHALDDVLAITIQAKPSQAIHAVPQGNIDIVWPNEHPEDEPLTHQLFHHLEHLRSVKPYRLHTVELDIAPEWGHTTRYNTDPKWLSHLKSEGYSAMQDWLERNEPEIKARANYGHSANENELVLG